MFRIECFVDDKNLAAVMHALAGQVRDLKVVPVANATVVKGKIKAPTNGDVVDLFAAYLKERRITTVVADTVRDFQKSVGRSPDSYGSVLKKAREAGLIKKVAGGNPKNCRYTVNR